VTPLRRPAEVIHRIFHPRATVRGRLAVLYGGLFLASGAALLTITYILADDGSNGSPGNPAGTLYQASPTPTGSVVSQLVAQQHNHDLHALLVGSSIALAIMTVASVAAGWLLAGRVLRPLRTMTSTAQQISEDNLHQRLALPGPRDELKDLGDTIDALLARLEAAFRAQQNFVANASHELRTPLTLSRATLQVALSDPGLTLETLRAACEEAIDTGRHQEHLIEALLILARSQRGLEHREPADLAAIVTEVAGAHQEAAAMRGVRLHIRTEPATVSGDAPLLERLVSNLVQNALQYNVQDGEVLVAVQQAGAETLLKVTNTGPVVPGDQISRMLQPFQRVAAQRIAEPDGLGLGLSIVQAIAAAHHAELYLSPRRPGGLDIDVRFRRPTAHRSLTSPKREHACSLTSNDSS
jgi:signal transduction histidine kinase